MKEFQQQINSSYPPILSLTPKDSGKGADIPIQIMDEQTYHLLETDKLFDAVNFTRTKTGSAILRRSLRQPLTDTQLITQKQRSLEELRSDDKLRGRIRDFIEEARKDEEFLYSHYRGDYSASLIFVGNSIYNTYKGSSRLLTHLMTNLSPENVTTPYLKVLLENFADLKKDAIADFIKGPVYTTFKGIRHFDDIGKFYPEPLLEFKATDWGVIRTAIMAGPLAGVFGMVLSGNPDLFAPAIMLELLYAVYPLYVRAYGRTFDNKLYVKPLADMYFNNQNVLNAIESLGKLDELLSLADYADYLQTPVTLPEISDSPYHFFEALDLRNPVLAKENPDYIGNDVNLGNGRLTFLTGPNSGGKTCLSRTILHCQLLAQIGSYIPASKAKIAIADGIYYHSPMTNSLADDEGRFGVEIKRTAEIFFKTTPKSVVILDELIEATTYEEKIKHSRDILEGFYDLGSSTILVTHNHELAEYFKDKGQGQFWQVEFKEQAATHKIIPGISLDSHAEQVLMRMGFTKEDIRRHVDYVQLTNG